MKKCKKYSIEYFKKQGLKPKNGEIKYGQVNLFEKEGSLSYREIFIPKKHQKKIIASCIIIGFCSIMAIGLIVNLPLGAVIFFGIIGGAFGWIIGLP